MGSEQLTLERQLPWGGGSCSGVEAAALGWRQQCVLHPALQQRDDDNGDDNEKLTFPEL